MDNLVVHKGKVRLGVKKNRLTPRADIAVVENQERVKAMMWSMNGLTVSSLDNPEFGEIVESVTKTLNKTYSEDLFSDAVITRAAIDRIVEKLYQSKIDLGFDRSVPVEQIATEL